MLSRPEGTAPEGAPSESLAEKVREQVAEAGEAFEVEAAGAGGAAAHAVVAIRVVHLAPLRIGQHLIGLSGFLELFLAVGVVHGHVGMMLTRQLAIGLLYLVRSASRGTPSTS